MSESKNLATPEVPMPPTKPRSGPSGCGGSQGLRWWGRHSCACLSSCPSTTKPPGTPFGTKVHAHWFLPLALEPFPAQSRPFSLPSTAQAKEYPEPPKLVMGKKGSQKYPRPLGLPDEFQGSQVAPLSPGYLSFAKSILQILSRKASGWFWVKFTALDIRAETGDPGFISQNSPWSRQHREHINP